MNPFDLKTVFLAKHAQHVVLIHFLVALLMTAAAFDLIGQRTRRSGFVLQPACSSHIHQTMQKVEGQVTFHTAMSTAFPQPQAGKADSPGPMKVPAKQLRTVLGITDVNYVRNHHSLAIADSNLG